MVRINQRRQESNRKQRRNAITSGDTKKNLNAEVEAANEAEISEETLEELNGGGVGLFGNSYLKRHLPGMPKKPRKPMEPEEPEEPTDGGATGSW